MDAYTQTEASDCDIPENEGYFPGIRMVEEWYLENKKMIVIVRCPVTNDFSTQTEQSRAFNSAVDAETSI